MFGKFKAVKVKANLKLLEGNRKILYDLRVVKDLYQTTKSKSKRRE